MAQVRRLASIVQNDDDDYMTPAFALQDLFSYIRENAEGLTVWEPFFGDGGSTRKIRELGYNVIGCEGKDFYVAPPPEGENIILVTTWRIASLATRPILEVQCSHLPLQKHLLDWYLLATPAQSTA
jgi:hypothetical protein